MLDAAIDGAVDADCRKARGDLALDGLHKGVRLGLMGVEIAHDLVIALGIEVFEAGILQLPFDLLHAEPVGQRRIDVHGLAGLGDLLFRALELHGAGVVQAVGDLDEDDADVLAHGHEHLAQVLHLLLLERGVLHARQLCDALDERGDRRPEIAGDVIVGRVRILDAVVQQRAQDGVRIEADLRDDLRHSQRMDDIGRAVLALLGTVVRGGVAEGGVDLGEVCAGVVGADGLDQMIVLLLHHLGDGLGGLLNGSLLDRFYVAHALLPPFVPSSPSRRAQR